MNRRIVLLAGLASLMLSMMTGCALSTSAGPATPELAKETPVGTGGEPTGEAASGLPVFYLVPEESEARFLIDEVLAGAPTNVVGTTHDVEGSLVPDFEKPSNTTVNKIRVDMSTLKTDNDMRNGAIHGFILQTDNQAFRYAEFETTTLSGLPDKVVIGQPFAFQITGNMTIHGVTKEVTFDATATAVSETRLEGTASLKILYADYSVSILRLPRQVASVGDEVTLELQFVAAPK